MCYLLEREKDLSLITIMNGKLLIYFNVWHLKDVFDKLKIKRSVLIRCLEHRNSYIVTDN